jgi:hypothetical protein
MIHAAVDLCQALMLADGSLVVMSLALARSDCRRCHLLRYAGTGRRRCPRFMTCLYLR